MRLHTNRSLLSANWSVLSANGSLLSTNLSLLINATMRHKSAGSFRCPKVKFEFEFEPRNNEESEFLDLVGFGKFEFL